ncbi:hypothetical protein ACIOK4_13785 [Streptomyces bottropensis]|uniref:hypothetical protein n=1 Tax=Streptomyces bottropensis TaxID=42235 RepID=UPI00380BF59D
MTEQTTAQSKTHRLMAALSVAERLTAESPITPSNLRVDGHSDWASPLIGVLLYFHRDPEAVRVFAEHFSLTVLQRGCGEDDEYTLADGVVDGVPFRAWSLTEVKSSAVAA